MNRKEAIQNKIIELLEKRGPEKSICPSEVARSLFPDNWRDFMEAVRQEGRIMARQNQIWVSQKQTALSPEEGWKGAIRFRQAQAFGFQKEQKSKKP